jgi:hypothetical protein
MSQSSLSEFLSIVRLLTSTFLLLTALALPLFRCRLMLKCG